MTDIYVNVPVADLERSKAFYIALGATIHPGFSDDNQACVVWDDNVFLMLHRREVFATLTDKPVADAHVSTQVIVALSRTSRSEVDRVIEAGISSGGKEPRPGTDLGYIYDRDLEDPDGNILEFLYLEPQA